MRRIKFSLGLVLLKSIIGPPRRTLEKADLRDSRTLQFFCILAVASVPQVPCGSEISHGNISCFARMYTVLPCEMQ